FVGIAAGCGAAFGVGKMRSTFATAGKLETAFELPVVGTISLALNEAARALEKKRRRLFYAAAGGLGGVFMVLLAAEFVGRSLVA
ncbi:MAG TPA: chain-length determining protein, partial [Croceibacterium sp.]